MRTGTASAPEGAADEGFDKAWRAMRGDENLQFAEVELPQADPPPDWLKNFLEWIGELFAPLARALVGGWPVLKWALLAVAAALLLYALWRLIGPMLGKDRREKEAGEEWLPDEAEALALLEDADRLAQEGRYDEATHLLLQRSVGQIAAARPDWVDPATTARELAAFEPLPAGARTAFSVIADRVESSLFTLRSLNEDDWTAARRAYADFAMARLPA